jgi:hypothetical protein
METEIAMVQVVWIFQASVAPRNLASIVLAGEIIGKNNFCAFAGFAFNAETAAGFFQSLPHVSQSIGVAVDRFFVKSAAIVLNDDT